MALWSVSDGQLRLPKEASQSLAKLPSAVVTTFLGHAVRGGGEGANYSIAHVQERDVVAIDLRHQWDMLNRNPRLSNVMIFVIEEFLLLV